MGKKFGIDVGGTGVKIGYFDNDELVDKFNIPTNKENNGSEVIKEISDAVKAYATERGIDLNDIDGYGFGIPGPVQNNIATICPNLGWINYDVKKEFNKYIVCDNVAVANDANVAAAGEFWVVGSGVRNLVMLTFGTGVGGGIIVDGKVIEGANGAAGELGHIPSKIEGGNQCGCGNTGCLETIASATGIVTEAKKALLESNKESTLRHSADLTAKEVFDAAKSGDIVALECVDQLGKYVGIACANIAATVDPDLFIIGGGVSAAGEILIDTIKKWYTQFAMKPFKDTPFEIAKLGNDAGIYGAAYITTK